jgi:hypothetical protein
VYAGGAMVLNLVPPTSRRHIVLDFDRLCSPDPSCFTYWGLYSKFFFFEMSLQQAVRTFMRKESVDPKIRLIRAHPKWFDRTDVSVASFLVGRRNLTDVSGLTHL